MISIILPVYNVESYLEDAFNSILNQSIGFENLQVIFVDDASTDSSPQIIQKYSSEYDNVISILLEENSGYAGLPRNIGMKYATEDYLMFLDPDDVFLENACEILHNQITSNSLDIVCGSHVDSNGIIPNWTWRLPFTNPNDNEKTRFKKANEIINNSKYEFQINAIDEHPTVIAAANVWDKIFKKSLIDENNIEFPISIPAEDSVFLLNALLNAHGIKFINKKIVKHEYTRMDSAQHQYSKTKFLKRIKAYFMMYYLCIRKNKTELFKHYLLLPKLKHILFDHIMKYNLPPMDILEVLTYVKPLFKLYCDYDRNVKYTVFKDIAYGNFENVLKYIYGKDTPKLIDIKCIFSTNNSFEYGKNLDKNWINQFKTFKPDLFVYDKFHVNADILQYCVANNIKTVLIKENISLESILNSIDFNYIPYLKHIVLFYHLNDIRDLSQIKNHFYSIDYPYKHLKLITDEKNLFLPDTLLESDLNNVDLKNNYYFCFADLNLDSNFISKSLLNFSSMENYIHENTENNNSLNPNNIYNIIFNNEKFKEIIPIYKTATEEHY